MIYRNANEDDAEELTEIANSYVMEQDISAESIRNLIKDRTIKVAAEDEEVVGYISYRVASNEGEDKVIVQHFGVVPEHRGGDVPFRLLELPVGFADSEGMTTRIAVERGSWITRVLGEEGFESVGEERFGSRRLVVYEG